MDMQEQEFGHDTAALEEAQPLMMRPKPDGRHDPMGEAGWFLERERESRGETLEAVGDKIGIHPYHLEAIEFGDMTRMPARLEALEMISAYAQYLGFDPEPLVVHYVQHLPKPAVAPRASHPADPAPLSSAKVLFFGRMPKIPPLNINISKLPGGAGGLVASVAGVMMLFMGASWIMSPDAPSSAPQVAESAAAPAMPETTTADAGEVKITEEKMAEEQTATIDPDQGAADPLPAVDEGDGSVDGLGAFIAEQIPEKAGEQPATAPEAPQQIAMAVDDARQAADGSTIYGAGNSSARVVLKAKSAVWVRIEDARGNVVMTQLLKAGDSYNVPDTKGLVVIARDGGLISYSIDGQDQGILGTPGEILVGRSLDIANLKG